MATRAEGRTRLPRGESQATTRSELLRAATASFRRHGFHATSVAEVADRAGYSTGAVYSNFSSKEDLLLAVLDERIAEGAAGLAAALMGAADLHDLLGRVTAWFGHLVADDPDWPVLMIEFAVHVRHREALREQLGARHRRTTEVIAGVLEFEAARFGRSLVAPPALIASAIVGLGLGLIVEQLLDPTAPAVVTFDHGLHALLAVT